MDPLNQAGLPMSPPEAPGVPMGAPGAPELSQEQMRSNLQEIRSKIEEKQQDLNSQNFVSANREQEMRGDTLRQIFDLFQANGVDPNNLEEVRVFLEKIKASNPELSQQLEQALKTVLGEEGLPQENMGDMGEENGGMSPENMNINNINSNENPQQNL